MLKLIKPWLKYFIFAGFVGVCLNLIYLAVPVYVMVVYDKVLFSFSQASLYTLSVMVLLSLVAAAGLEYVKMRLMGQAGTDIAQEMTPHVFRQMQADALTPSGPVYTRGIQDLECLRQAIVRGDILGLLDLPWGVIYLVILYLIHPLVGGVAAAGVFMVVISQIFLKKIQKNRRIAADTCFSDGDAFAQGCVRRAPLIAGMGMGGAVLDTYQTHYRKGLTAGAGADAIDAGVGALIKLLHWTVILAVFTAGAYVFFRDEITMGEIFAGVLVVFRLFYPLARGLSAMAASIRAMAAYRRLREYVRVQADEQTLSLPSPEGQFEVAGLGMSLSGRPVLHNINFALAPGEMLGIIGGAAVGKSVLCKLLLGIWPPMAGKIRLDGAEIGQYDKDQFGACVGYLPQTAELFPGSVAENIARLGIPDSEQVVRAAKQAGIHEMVLKLPNGYDTLIDTTGRNLAAGQRQLISLARALYANPRLLVLDAPHTHLDELGLRHLADALKGAKQDQVTAVVVTDRPGLIAMMDKLLLIKEGQVAMYGPAADVLGQLKKMQQPQRAAGV